MWTVIDKSYTEQNSAVNRSRKALKLQVQRDEGVQSAITN